MGQENFFCFWT